MRLYSYLSSDFRAVFFKITASLFLLSLTHALVYAFKNIQNIDVPAAFFFLFLAKDIFRSLPFIVNLSFALSLISWQYSLRLKKQDMTALLCQFPQKSYRSIILFFSLSLTGLNLFCLFFIVPLLNYQIDTQLYPKILYHSMMSIPDNHAVEIDQGPIFYFEHSETPSGTTGRIFKNVKILTFDENKAPYVIATQNAVLSQETYNLALFNGTIHNFSADFEKDSEINFERLDYQLFLKGTTIGLGSLSFKQLFEDKSPKTEAQIFWALYLAFLPFAFFATLLLQNVQVQFSGSLHFEVIIALSYFLWLMILGVSAKSFIESSQYSSLLPALFLFFGGSVFFRRLYNQMVR